jgi:hypothetical protein
MHATLRYYQVNDIDAITRNVNEEFLDIVREVPGFSAYHVVDLGDGTMVTVTLAEDAAGVEASDKAAAEWVGGNEEMQNAIAGGPRTVSGEIVAGT